MTGRRNYKCQTCATGYVAVDGSSRCAHYKTEICSVDNCRLCRPKRVNQCRDCLPGYRKTRDNSECLPVLP